MLAALSYDFMDVDYCGGKIPRVIKYTYEGRLHNSGKPALLEYYPSGIIKRESYYYNGKLHRSFDRPALIEYNEYPQRSISRVEYYKYGIKYTPP